MHQNGTEAVIITGVFGSGKSSVAAEIADVLEKQHLPYALLDLDYLAWFDAGDDGPTVHEMISKNLNAVVENYHEVGVRYFVLARSLRDASELQDLKLLLPMQNRIVRLVVPLSNIAERLRADPTTGRRDDLRRAGEWIERSLGVGFEDLAVSNEGSIQEVARDIVDWLAWS